MNSVFSLFWHESNPSNPSVMSMEILSGKSSFLYEYLRKIEDFFKNSLTCLTGAQMGYFSANNWRVKMLSHRPFNMSSIYSRHNSSCVNLIWNILVYENTIDSRRISCAITMKTWSFLQFHQFRQNWGVHDRY